MSPQPPGTVGAISCPTTTFCAAGTNLTTSSSVYMWNGSTWTTTGGYAYMPNVLDCLSSTFCAVGDYKGYVGFWNGSTWASPASGAVSAIGIGSLSCASTTYCIAAGGTSATTTQTYLWTGGSSWGYAPSGIRVSSNNNYTAVSCTISGWCGGVQTDTTNPTTAVFGYNTGPSLWTWNDTSNDISCPEAGYCVIVGGYYYDDSAVVSMGTATSITSVPQTDAMGNTVTPTYVVQSASSSTGPWSPTANGVFATYASTSLTANTNPEGIAYGGGNVYVANYGANTVSVINASTNAVTSPFARLSEPTAITYDNGYVYVSCHGAANNTTVDYGYVYIYSVSSSSTVSILYTLGDNPGGIVGNGAGVVYDVASASPVSYSGAAYLSSIAETTINAGAPTYFRAQASYDGWTSPWSAAVAS